MEDKNDFNDDDAPMSPEKRARRIDFVTRSLKRFADHFNEKSRSCNSSTTYTLPCDKPEFAIHPAKIVLSYQGFRNIICDMVYHGEDKPFIDRHKIIAGKQAAIMSVAPLRVAKYMSLTGDDLDRWRKGIGEKERGNNLFLNPKELSSDARPAVESMILNAQFAFSLGVDILCTWNGLEKNAANFIAANGPLLRCYVRLLVNTYGNMSETTIRNNSFFWCSHLWFALEEKLLYWAKYGKLIT